MIGRHSKTTTTNAESDQLQRIALRMGSPDTQQTHRVLISIPLTRKRGWPCKNIDPKSNKVTKRKQLKQLEQVDYTTHIYSSRETAHPDIQPTTFSSYSLLASDNKSCTSRDAS